MASTYFAAYAAFGSNLDREAFRRRAPDAIDIGTGTIRNWALRFRQVADIEPAPGRSVPVAIYALSSNDSLAVDWYEGISHDNIPGLYQKVRVDVETDTGTVPAFSYRLTEPAGELAIPWRGYLGSIEAGYVQHNLPLGELHRAVSESDTTADANADALSDIPAAPTKVTSIRKYR